MSTSGNFVQTVTRDTIIREALVNTGKIGGTQYIAPQLITDCALKLNMMVRQWMGRQDFAPGLKMWSRSRGDLFLSQSRYAYSLGPSGDNWAGGIAVAQPNQLNYGTDQLSALAAAAATTIVVGVGSTGNYTVNDFVVIQLNSGDIYSTTITAVNAGAGTFTIPAPGLPSPAGINNYLWNYTTQAQKPLEFQSVVLRDINSNDTPLDFMNLQAYELLPTKTMATYLADPTAIYYEPSGVDVTTLGVQTQANGTLYIDCGGAQDVTKHIHAVFLRPLQTFVNPLDNPDFSEEWYLPLAWGLTKQIAPMMNAVFTKDMQDNLDESLAIARSANPETSDLYFQPNADRP